MSAYYVMEKVNSQFIKSLTKLSAREMIALIGVGITLLLFWQHHSNYFWIEFSFLVEILVVTLFTRTITVRYALAIFSQGILMCFMMILLWNTLYAVGFNMDSAVWSGVMIPVIEELLKITPAVLAAWWLYKKRNQLLNISDWLTLTAMGGTGFSILEKYFWDNVQFAFTYGPHLGSWYFFPDALGIYINNQAAGYIGHGAGSGLIGLGIGLGIYLKYKVNEAATWWWAIPGTALAWITLEHILNNIYYANGSNAILSLGGGQLTPWLFIIVLVVALIIEIKESQTFVKRHPAVIQHVQFAQQYLKDTVHQSLWLDVPLAIIWLIAHQRVINALSWKVLLTKHLTYDR